MYFDPLSAWLVSLIADGIIISGEKFGGNSAQAEYDRKRIKQQNEELNADIRKTKEKFGLIMPEQTYESIQRRIKITKDSIVFKYTNAPIIIDLDNQEYLISLLEECSKRYSKYSSEEYLKKADWFKNAAIEARRRKEQYVKTLEEIHTKKEQEHVKQKPKFSKGILIYALITTAILTIIMLSAGINMIDYNINGYIKLLIVFVGVPSIIYLVYYYLQWLAYNPIRTKKIGIIMISAVIILPILYLLLNNYIIQPYTQERNLTEFQSNYKDSLLSILHDNNLELLSIEYTPLVPDLEKDYYEPDRINEYEVKVYIKGNNANDYKALYDLILSIRSANDYLLSNTYEILPSYAYVDEDCEETGFHEVHTTLIFEDKTEYKIDFISLLKNNVVVYKREIHSGGSSNIYSNDVCGYPECDHNRADGKPYCHQHSCGESGCNNSTDLLPSYCDEHNCTYGSCTAPRYKAVGSTYCQRHYIESLN